MPQSQRNQARELLIWGGNGWRHQALANALGDPMITCQVSRTWQPSAYGRLFPPATIDIGGQIILCSGVHPGHCRRVCNNPCLYPVNARSTHFPVMTTTNVCRYRHLSPGEQNCPGVQSHWPPQLLTRDGPSSQGTATETASPAACRSDSAGGREERAGLRVTLAHSKSQWALPPASHITQTKPRAWSPHQSCERGSWARILMPDLLRNRD